MTKQLVSGILTLFWAAATVAMAQPQTMQIGTSFGGIAVPGFLPPALDPTDPAGYWANALGLDTGQQSALKTILADQQNSMSAMRDNLEQARTALVAAAKANSADSEIDRLSSGLGATYAQAVAAQAKAYARLTALLTPDQKQKLDKLTALPPAAGLAVFGTGGPGLSSAKQ